MSAIFWSDLPPLSGPESPHARYVEVLRRVRTRPGEWAIIKSGSVEACNATAAALRLRQWHVPPGTWEFVVRQFRRGVHVEKRQQTAHVYARFVRATEATFNLGTVSTQARFTRSGKRACVKCGTVLARKQNKGPWPKWCAKCR